MRAYAFIDASTIGNPNTTLELIALGSPPHHESYYIQDYPLSEKEGSDLGTINASLGKYGLKMDPISIAGALKGRDSIILIPTDALPDALADGGIVQLVESNTVIFYGKPLTIAEDSSGSQMEVNDTVLQALNLTSGEDRTISPTIGGPAERLIGNATVFEYYSGRIIIYPEDGNPAEITDLIAKEKWQSHCTVSAFDGGDLIFSDPLPRGKYFMRMLYDSSGSNFSASGVEDSVPSCFSKDCGAAGGTLSINDTPDQSGQLDYTYELWGNLSFPKTYYLHLEFIRDNLSFEASALPATMKTYATESGQIHADLPPDSYIVDLVDQDGVVHATAYTHVPDLRIRLIRIEDYTHVFNISLDGSPLSGQRISLMADGKNFSLTTDANGLAKISFVLGAGRHSFTVDAGGLEATTYYTKPDDQSDLLIYLFFALFVSFAVVAAYLNGRMAKRFTIRSNPLRSSQSKAVVIPYQEFRELFARIQEDRAPGLPLTVRDIRIGIMKHATFEGRALFLTDSNIYRVVDKLARNGTMLFHEGYSMPAEAAHDTPIEYWVMRRKISERLMEIGERFLEKDRAFWAFGKRLHIWPDIFPETLAGKTGNLLIFPDEERKSSYLAAMRGSNALMAQILLELKYGKTRCVTIDEWLGGRK